MSEILVTKIDWVELVPYNDYLRLKEEKQELEYLWDINEELKEENKKLREWIKSDGQIVTMREYTIYRLEEENIKLKSDLEQFSEAYKIYRDYEKEELAESCYDLERENKKLEYLWDINEELKEENEKLKEQIDKLLNHN